MRVSKSNTNLIISISIPVLICLLAFFQHYFEYYFRFSKEYKYIYSYGSTFRLFTQFCIIFWGALRGIDLLIRKREFMTNGLRIISGLIAISPLLYLLIGLSVL